jgi:CRISPR-associated endonuclease/helicase Cas3
MRVLVEQTEGVVRDWLGCCGLLWDGNGGSHRGKVGVHVLMGGSDAAEWHLFPEESAVIIGTQDMLLSRALNRGYACPRARWPMEFAQLHQDCLWVLDEVQLMDSGLATSVQLQAFRDTEPSPRKCFSWWMSATLQPSWLDTVDAHSVDGAPLETVTIPDRERGQGLWEVRKALSLLKLAPPPRAHPEEVDSDFRARVQRHADETLRAWVDAVRRAHEENEQGPFGRVTLVVVNTVARAVDLHAALRDEWSNRRIEVELVHSRFRPYERVSWVRRFLSRAACTPGADRVIVATQVVEAGVDLSAGALVTELAPWVALVQRFGRVARYLDAQGRPVPGRIIVVDEQLADSDERRALPYTLIELAGAQDAVDQLVASSADAGVSAIELLERTLSGQQRAALFPYDPQFVLRRRDFADFFDTSQDLTGAEVDVSRFIRTGPERDVLVFWRGIDPQSVPDSKMRPRRAEVCRVPIGDLRAWLGRRTSGVFVWDYLAGAWRRATEDDAVPGRVFLASAVFGGYDPERGWDPDWPRAVPEVPEQEATEGRRLAVAEDEADESMDSEALSQTEAAWQTIAGHGFRAAQETASVAAALTSRFLPLLHLAARWHDYGKCHPVFQRSIRGRNGAPPPTGRQDLAKAPKTAWARHERAGFRHELASALALLDLLACTSPGHDALAMPWRATGEPAAWDVGEARQLVDEIARLSVEEFDLLLWLVATHHGKVRVSLTADPRDGLGASVRVRGIEDGDELPEIEMCDAAGGRHRLPRLACRLDVAGIGLSDRFGASWSERIEGLIRRHGPFELALLETLLRVADIRASRHPGDVP